MAHSRDGVAFIQFSSSQKKGRRCGEPVCWVKLSQFMHAKAKAKSQKLCLFKSGPQMNYCPGSAAHVYEGT
jgi:hypothetical protein